MKRAILGSERSPSSTEGRQSLSCPPRASSAVMRYLTVRRYPHRSAPRYRRLELLKPPRLVARLGAVGPKHFERIRDAAMTMGNRS